MNSLSRTKHHYVMIRYSVLAGKGKSAWKIGKKNYEDYKDSLFDEKRLALHEFLFKHVTLPSLIKAKKDHSVTVFVFTSESLPSKSYDNLMRITSGYKWVKVVPLPSYVSMIPAMEEVLVSEIKEQYKDVIYSSIRIDDDDAVSDSFFDKLDSEMTCGNVGKGVSFSTGYGGLFDIEKRRYVSFHEMRAINIAIGLSMIASYNGKFSFPPSIFGVGSHSRLHLTHPVIVNGSSHMYIRTVHAAGDFFSDEYKERISRGDKVSREQVSVSFGLDDDLV